MELLMHPATFVVLLGIVMSAVAWIWFRREGQRFWAPTFRPVWRASEFLAPPGAKLWGAGSLVSLIGVLWLLWWGYVCWLRQSCL